MPLPIQSKHSLWRQKCLSVYRLIRLQILVDNAMESQFCGQHELTQPPWIRAREYLRRNTFHMLDLYFVVRGEILGFTKDELLRNHLSRTLSLIKN